LAAKRRRSASSSSSSAETVSRGKLATPALMVSPLALRPRGRRIVVPATLRRSASIFSTAASGSVSGKTSTSSSPP